MRYKFLIIQLLIIFILLVSNSIDGNCQKAWFADGYHGGVYGHYSGWQTRFMVETLKDNPSWKINLEIEPETWDSVKANNPDDYELFRDYYATEGRNGRIEFVNPAYAQPYNYNIRGESIIRQFRYGMDKTREHFPDASFTTYSSEEPCFTSSLPMILKGFGYEYLVLKNPNTCWGGYTSAFGKDFVKLNGPDGQAMLTVPRYECEKLSDETTWQTIAWGNSKDYVTGCLENGVKNPVGMCFQDVGWDGGPWLDYATGDHYEPSEYVLWTEYFEMIKDRVEAEKREFSQEDVKPGLVWGASVLQNLARQVRNTENILIASEKLASLDKVFHDQPYPEDEFREAWRTLMLAQHHDCWIVPYNEKDGETWAGLARRWTRSSDQIAEKQIDQLYANLISATGKKNLSISVFNTLGHARSGLVAVNIPDTLDSSACYVTDASGRRVRSQITSPGSDNERTLFLEAEVPAMGYRAYHLKKGESETSEMKVKKTENGKLQIETRYYSAIFDREKGGTISQLQAKELDNIRLVADGGNLNNLEGYFFDQEKFLSGNDSRAKVEVTENGELLVRVRVENKLADHNYIQWITFYDHTPRIDFELKIDWNGQPSIGAFDQSGSYSNEDPEKAFYNDAFKLHLQFPFKEMGHHLFKNAPFDVCKSQLDNTTYNRWDSIKHNVILNWVDVTDRSAQKGVALFSDHTTSYLQSDSLPLGLTVQYAGKGLWGRDYRVHGPSRIKYALFPHTGDWEEGGVQAESRSWNERLKGRLSDSAVTNPERSFLELADRNIELVSLEVQEGELYARLFNSSSEERTFDIEWHEHVHRPVKVDLNGRLLDVVKMRKTKNGKRKSTLSLPGFGIRTLRIDLPSSEASMMVREMSKEL